MQKLMELEKKLKEAKAALEKIGGGAGMPGSVSTTGGSSIASQIGFGKKEDDKDEDKEKKDKKHPDEKEDKKMIASALDRHNEKKHGEAKDTDSAQKDMGLEKAINKFGAQQEAKRTDAMNSARQVATEINPKTGDKKAISPEAQVKAKVDSAAEKKGKAEAEAAARRMSYRQDGVLKSADFDEDVVKFDSNGQWSLTKAVRQPSIGSPAAMENPATVEGAAKPKKYQGGDPKHADRGPTRAGQDREQNMDSDKPHSLTAGTSSLRNGTKSNPQTRDKTWTKDGKETKWNT